MTQLQYDSFLVDIKKYKEIRELGRGRFGIILLAEKKDKDGNIEKYAIRDSGQSNSEATKHLFREIETFIQIKAHPTIIKFYGYSLQPQRIVLEYLPNHSLQYIFDRLLQGKKVDVWNGTMKSKTVFGLACALLHLHNQNAMHRYLTPSSVLFDENYNPRLSDFAYSKIVIDDTIKTAINTSQPIYQAPELSTDNYDQRVDNFAFGVILYQIITGREAFNSKLGVYRVQQAIASNKRPELPNICPKLEQMIGDLWSSDPDDRTDIIYIIKSLNDYDEELFPDTDLNEYFSYRERVLKSTDLSEEQIAFLNQPKITKENMQLFQNYMEEAQRGDQKSMVKVARCLEKGIGAERDINESISWYEKAAKAGNPEALYKMANFYSIGKGDLEIDNTKYVSYLKKASDKNYPPAINDYAFLLLVGYDGIAKNEIQAVDMLKKMANAPNNYPEAQYRLAQYYDSKSNPAEAIKYYNMARNNGFEAAHCDYALMLLNGTNVEKDIPEGMKILEQAADRGFQMANYNLGFIFEYGKFEQEKNADLSFKYYEAAAKKNMTLAIVKVAKALFKGVHMDKRIEKDEIRSARLFLHAANLGDREGLHSYGSFLQSGYGGIPIDITNAVKFYEKAAQKGFVPSMVRLGDLYNLGINGSRNPDKARTYYQMAIDNGSKIAEERIKDV